MRNVLSARTEVRPEMRKQLTGSVHIRFDKDIHASNPVELDFFLFVLPPVAHPCKVFAMCAVFFVACEEGDLVSIL